MTHATEDLSAYLDGALGDEERALVEAHLATCAACAGELARLRLTLGVLGRMPPAPEPSPAFARTFWKRLEEERTPWERFLGLFALPRWFYATSMGVAAAAGLAIVAVQFRDAHAFRQARDMEIAQELDLLENYELVESVDAVENEEDADVVAHLDELTAKPTP